MKFDDLDRPIDELLHADSDFRFYDRQFKLRAQVRRADGDTPASAVLELARRRGALLATLSGAYRNRARRVEVHRAHVSGASCGVHASVRPFPPDAPMALGHLCCIARGQVAFAGGGDGAVGVGGVVNAPAASPLGDGDHGTGHEFDGHGQRL